MDAFQSMNCESVKGRERETIKEEKGKERERVCVVLIRMHACPMSLLRSLPYDGPPMLK